MGRVRTKKGFLKEIITKLTLALSKEFKVGEDC